MIGANVARRTPGSIKWISQCKVVKALDDPAIFADAPDDGVRVFRASNPTSIEDAIARLGGYRHSRLYVEWLFEVEPLIGSANYAEWVRHAVAVAHANGLRLCGPVWGSGAFDQAAWSWFRANRWFGLDAIAIQAYWSHAKGLTRYNALRYRDYWKPWLDKPLIVVECGEDTVADGEHGERIGKPGYLANGVSGEEFRVELVQFNAETTRDGVPALIYEAGCPDDWKDFEIQDIAPVTEGVFSWPASGGNMANISVGEGFRRAIPLIGQYDENEIYHFPGTGEETSLAVTPRGYATYRKASNQTVVVADDGSIWTDRGNHGDGTLKQVAPPFP